MIMLQIFIFLLMMYNKVLSWESLYSELKHIGGSCFPRDSCYPVRDQKEDHLWNNFSCECGAHCLQYSTCCADSPYIMKLHDAKLQGETCEKVPGISNKVKLISKCSSRWYYSYQIQNMCENSKLEIDPIAMVPVTSLKTHITYKNYFCARCNCDVQDILFWKVNIELKTSEQDISNETQEYIMENIAYQSHEQSWGIMENETFYPTIIEFNLPSSLQKIVKKCYSNMVSKCNSSYEHSSELQQKCLSYYAPIQLRVGSSPRKFRNMHCALCNNASRPEIGDDFCSLDKKQRKTPKPAFSFALLLDINASDGDLVGKVKLCEGDQTWDPFFKKCRSLVCALPGHVVKNGKCVKN